MKKLAYLMLIVGAVVVLTGCEKTPEEKREDAANATAEQVKTESEGLGTKVEKTADDVGKKTNEMFK